MVNVMIDICKKKLGGGGEEKGRTGEEEEGEWGGQER